MTGSFTALISPPPHFLLLRDGSPFQTYLLSLSFIPHTLDALFSSAAMFEGLVRQLLAGYLGRYVKDLQLKIGLWNGNLNSLSRLRDRKIIWFRSHEFNSFSFHWSEEVLLENVELILEAFDYLQLPVALKQGLLIFFLHSFGDDVIWLLFGM